MKPLRAIVLTLAAGVLAGRCAAAGPESVDIPQAGQSSSPLPLKGFLYQPAGPGPVPAVVMLHGCGGAYARSGGLNERHRLWGEWLSAHGYAALLVDSFTSRGLQEICTVKFAERSLKEADRVGDAAAALAFLNQRPGIRSGRVALLGWSHGGGVVLAAVGSAPAPAFRAAVAFYPGCTARARRAESFHPAAPLLVFIGEADDWTPAAPCKDLAASVAARGEPMRIVTFPDTFHDFDNPALKGPRHRADVPNGVKPGAGVTVAPNPAARDAAQAQVLEFLAAQLR